MLNGKKGSSIGEYMIVLLLVAVVAIIGTYAYQKFFVKKSFDTAIESLETGDDVSSELMEENTSKIDKVKLAAPVFLAIFTFLIFLMIIFSTISAAKKSKRKLKDLGDDEDGQALTEFILIFPLQLFITLCIMQLSLIYTARLVVNYAAFNAARAAIVVIPQSMEDEIAGHINLPSNEENNENESSGNNSDDTKKQKYKLIKKAAALSLMPICHGSKAFLKDFKITLFGGTTVSGMDIVETLQIDEIITLLGKFIGFIGDVFGVNDLDKYTEAVSYRFMYASLFTDINILDENLDQIYDEKEYSRSDLVVVKVKFPYYLVIPIANKFMGKKFNKELFDDLGLSSSTQEYLGYLDNQYFSVLKIDCSGYVYPITAECAMHVEMKAKH
ncbi:hypothetical protein TTHT_0753 [Thermotomaculum hydrothermale]|uniref:TadE-like domain-containing protein n=1 Tax=Thermotomaculum hydrothermale TaxID=981385 RepID=A0A7R6PQ71_9BACT|nr:TadE family protein [Thermotomaculum hydrothermale]BBB32321.1 hypothetical protein TTHT_0753 [Thermotomaculum hydrothermale]